VIAGLTRFSKAGHIARATLEAVAYQARDVLEAMEADSGLELSVLKVDGGMVANELLMQFQADLLSSPVVLPAVTETTVLGAAYAAGLAVGFWEDVEGHKALDRSLDWVDEE
jgi:glycerol kinase